MSAEQVEEILGQPSNTYISQYSELYMDDNLILVYTAGDYMVNYEIDSENEKIGSISI